MSFSQTAGGTIVGAVKDPQGAAVPEASVTISNNATGVTRALLTNRNGSYQAANVQPGSYGLTVKGQGFSIGLRKEITLNVGAEVVIDFDLQVGSVNETMEVSAQESTVDNQGRLTSNAGLITSTASDSRRIQFGLKLNF